MSHPAISVIVPVYNVEDYLVRCIESIQTQSFSNFELLLVNDASTDSSGLICDAYSKSDDRIKTIHLEFNRGLSSARNTGLDQAIGEYVALIDSDDWIPDNFLDVLIKTLESTQSDICACKVFKVWSNSDAKKFKYPSANNVDIYDGNYSVVNVLTKLWDISPTAWNKLYKRSLFGSIRYPEGVLHEDSLTTYKLIAQSNRVCVTSNTAYFYFQRPASITRGDFNPERLKSLAHVDDVELHVDMNNFDVGLAVEFFKYSFRIGLIDDMLDNINYKEQRRKLMADILENRSKLITNKYASFGVKASLLLLQWPSVYEFLKLQRRNVKHWLESHF